MPVSQSSQPPSNSRRSRTVFLQWIPVAVAWAVVLWPGAVRLRAAIPFTPGRSTSRVVVIQDQEATSAFRAQAQRVHDMVDRGILELTGKATVKEAWGSLVATNEVVGIKVYSLPGQHSGTRPAVVSAVVEGLLLSGLAPGKIVIWDKDSVDLRLAGFYALEEKYGIRLAGAIQAGYDSTNYYESPFLGNLVWGDLEFGKKGEKIGRKSFVSKLVSHQVTKIINIAPLLNHNQAGVSGVLYSLASGSVDNFNRFDTDADRLATAVPEIYALPSLSDHVILNVTDALVCQYEGGERGLLHYSAALNELRFSRDPVALDVLSLQDLEQQRRRSSSPRVRSNIELYQNAALLELGVANAKQIRLERFTMAGEAATSETNTPGPTKLEGAVR